MKSHLLQVLPSVIREVAGELEIEFDCCESLRLYLNNFDRVTIACPVSTEMGDTGLRRCRRVKDLPWADRLSLIPLPNAYRFSGFLRHYFAVKRSLRQAIERADYLVFSPHTLLGDWPTVAICEAIKLKRSYTIEADVVYEKVKQASRAYDVAWKGYVKDLLTVPLFQMVHRYCLSHSSLALLQGQDVYDAYSLYCRNPHKVYHMPISKHDYITKVQLQNKLSAATANRALRLCYVGRCIDMKGPLDWLKTLRELIESNIAITATWLGDGSLLSSMRIMAEKIGIADRVNFRGYVSDREEVLNTLRESDIFLFCHKTPESPRCLVEALASGCPLIGYGSAYPKDLVARCGGGQFAEVGNWRELAEIVKYLAKDRAKVCELIQSASTSGRLYERDATMQHRIDLIKKYLGESDDALSPRAGQFQ